MKKTNILFVICIVLSIFLFSCSKSKTTPVSTVTPVTYSSIDTIFSMLGVQPKTITMDAASGGSFYGNSGTRYIFYGNSFQTATGANVTGQVQVQLSEYLQKGDMLFSKMLPISNNEPLLSGGEINVVASQNGQPVFLQPHMVFQANIPQSGGVPAGIHFFSGQPSLDTTMFKTNWIEPTQDSSGYGVGMVNVVSGGDTLNIISDSLKMCNADAFMTAPDFQTFTVTMSITGVFYSSSIVFYGYTLYDDYKGEWPFGITGSYTNNVYQEPHVPNIPVHFVVFTLVNGNFYGGITGATPTTGSNYTVTLTEQDPVAFKTQINQL